MQVAALHRCPRGHEMYGPHGDCSACAAQDTPYGQALDVLLDAFAELAPGHPLAPESRPSPSGAPIEGEWLTRVVLAGPGLLRDLALHALAQPSAPAVARVVMPGAHAARLYLRGRFGDTHQNTHRDTLEGTAAIEEWVGGCPLRLAEVEAAHLERVAREEWSHEGADAEIWPAFLAAAAAFGGDHPRWLAGRPYYTGEDGGWDVPHPEGAPAFPGRDALPLLLGERGWAIDGMAQSIAWDGADALRYGGGRSFARLEFLTGGRTRLVCGLFEGSIPFDDPDAEPWDRDAARHESADAWRSVEQRVHFAVRVLRPPLAGLRAALQPA